MRLRSWPVRHCALALAALCPGGRALRAQTPRDTTPAIGVLLQPGDGFTVANTPLGTLRIGGYALVRWIDQLPPSQTYIDHLGREQPVKMRNDIHLHRVMLYFRGWLYDPKLDYEITVWTVNTTTQVAIIGFLRYDFAKQFRLSMGVNGIPGTRSMQGSHPLWMANDRVMADEFFKPGFTQGVWASGEILPRLTYIAMLANNLNQLGISGAQLSRNLANGESVAWMPTTGEFGPRGAYGDYEDHKKLATRIGASTAYMRDDRINNLTESSPDNTLVRLSDATLFFATGALAPGVTVLKANYRLYSADAGIKYRGLFVQSEWYWRTMSKFDADGPLPVASVYDHGFYVQAAYMVHQRKLELYTATSQIYGAFNRHPWEVLGGANIYPAATRNFRVNLQVMEVDRSPVNSFFGFYTGGQKGTTVSFASSILF